MHTETLIDTLELWGWGKSGERDEKAKDFFLLCKSGFGIFKGIGMVNDC